MLRAVIFDLDETLIDWSAREGDWNELTRQHLNPLLQHLKSAGFRLPALDEFAAIYREQSATAWENSGAPDWNCPRQVEIVRQTLRASGLNTSPLDMEGILTYFAWDRIPGVRPYDDTVSTLQSLRRAGLRIGLVTNAAFPMWMRDVELKSLGLLSHLDERLTAGDIGKLKPHPAPFNEILRRMEVTTDEAIFVGDRLQDDILGAQGVGMRGIWYRHGIGGDNETIRPNAIIDRLSDLFKILDIWFPGWSEQKR